MKDLGGALRSEMKDLSVQLRAETKALSRELRGEMSALSAELRSEMKDLRAEVKMSMIKTTSTNLQVEAAVSMDQDGHPYAATVKGLCQQK